MRILLLCSAFNGLSQRAWTELRAAGHEVSVQLAAGPDLVVRAVAEREPDLVLCPFLRERVPDEVWQKHRTIIIHPGPMGDRGSSSLDWAITGAEPVWGVTALQAIDEMDAGPIWATRTFPMPADPARKSTLYNTAVADAAISLIHEVVAKAADPTFEPTPLDYAHPDVIGRLRPTMKQADRAFSWSDSTEDILRRIRAADGSPGVRTTLADIPVSVFDAYPGSAPPGEPGTIALRRHGAVLVRTGDGAVWVGHAKRLASDARPAVKLPAAMALGRAVVWVPEALEPLEADSENDGYREISYRRVGDVGILHFDFYNGAMSTAQCHRLAAALRHATAQDTKVLLFQGGEVFSNGVHLNVIEAHADPMAEAWRNINAINDVCREIITCTGQLVISAVGGGAGAGGVMLALGADRVLLRDGVVLNPHYRTMGLYGSEYWTYVLPRRVGEEQAQRLTTACDPVGAAEAVRIGLADEVLTGDPAEFPAAALEYAAALAADAEYVRLLTTKRTTRELDERHRPLETYRIRELAEMSRDIFDDRSGFAAARHAFVTKQKPATTTATVPAPRPALADEVEPAAG
ncbi:hydrogenase maturation protein [Pseudonocardia hispaniensis]|uniref:Hydrogenase maturation protein n=1 Tax=Pseudonocardia hispaniensis TaxID=904933 RepID=A0ABW1IWD3_9PSEU